MPGGADTTAATDVESSAVADGRAARAVKSRAAIVDALLAIIEEGEVQPSAQRIAERAGISMRLIYHHFGDLESLFHAAANRQAERLLVLAIEVDPTLPLQERADRFVAHRCEMLEWITPVRRASLLHEPFSAELQAARDALMLIAEDQVRRLFADIIAALPEPAHDVLAGALTSTCGWGYWNDLRLTGRDPAAAEATVRLAVYALLGLPTPGDISGNPVDGTAVEPA